MPRVGFIRRRRYTAAEADAVAGSINLTELHDDGGRVELICKG